MTRLILFAAFISIVAFAVVVLLGAMRDVVPTGDRKDTAMIPAKFRRITYVLLVVLLFGVTSGWLGAA